MKINSETLYELINDGTIQENTKLKVYKDDCYVTLIGYDGYDFNWDAETFTSGMFYDPLVEFEVIEEEKEIEEIPIPDIDSIENERILRAEFKINELVREVNKLKGE